MILGETTPQQVTAAGGLYQLQGQDHHARHAHGPLRVRPLPGRLAASHLGRGGIRRRRSNNGIFFYGEKATVFVTDNRWIVIPRGQGQGAPGASRSKSDAGTAAHGRLPRRRPHAQAAGVPIDDAYRSTTTVQLAMIAYRDGRQPSTGTLRSEQIVGNAAAAKLLKREYRAPYKHPYAAG